jgi:hypothetical protein
MMAAFFVDAGFYLKRFLMFIATKIILIQEWPLAHSMRCVSAV